MACAITAARTLAERRATPLPRRPDRAARPRIAPHLATRRRIARRPVRLRPTGNFLQDGNPYPASAGYLFENLPRVFNETLSENAFGTRCAKCALERLRDLGCWRLLMEHDVEKLEPLDVAP